MLCFLTGCSSSSDISDNNDKQESDNKTATGINGMTVVELSGKEEDKYYAKDYCYLESDKYFLLIDKDIVLPGNFKDVLDEIVEEIEDSIGMQFMPAGYKPEEFDDISSMYGCTAWDNFYYGKKIPIFLLVDREDEGLGCWSWKDICVIVEYELFSDEVWNSVPSYRDNSWRREDSVNYMSITHELVHVLTLRKCIVNTIMTEGSAEFYTKKIMDKMYQKYGSEGFVYHTYNGEFDPELTSENAEEYFINDFSDSNTGLQGSEYTYGKFLCAFLEEKYGGQWLLDYYNAIEKEHFEHGYRCYSEDDLKKFTDIFKSLYGDDIFVEFGDWYQQNKEYLHQN